MLTALTCPWATWIAAMTTFRTLIFGGLVVAATLVAVPCRADTATAKPTTAQAATFEGTGGVYRIVATSAGVLLGAGAMSLFIDGWVVDAFMTNSGLTSREAFELVQDFDSQSGFEAAAVGLSGLAGGLIADGLYLKGAAALPGTVEAIDSAFGPPLTAIGNGWTTSVNWIEDHVNDTSDWFQNRTHEIQDRWQLWTERLHEPAGPLPSHR